MNSILDELEWDSNRGALTFEGVRYLLIRPETLVGYQRQLEAELGPEAAGRILFEGGRIGGRTSGQKYKDAFGLSDREAVEYMCRMGGEIGWGHFQLKRWAPEDGLFEVRVAASPFAEAYGGQAQSGVCHFTRGVLCGLGEGLFGAPAKGGEMACLAQGDEACSFRVVVAGGEGLTG